MYYLVGISSNFILDMENTKAEQHLPYFLRRRIPNKIYTYVFIMRSSQQVDYVASKIVIEE